MKIPNEKEGLNKRRHAMPQIKDFDAFMKDLEDNDVSVFTDSIDPAELFPTQGNFNEDKVKRMIDDGSWDRSPIISSDDDYVLDGHHRWLAAANAGKNVRSRIIGLPIDELLDFVKGKPYVETRGINEAKLQEDVGSTLQRVQDYYARVARGEGGERFASMLTRASGIRQLIQDNKDNVLKNRPLISQLMDKIEALIKAN